MGLTPPGAVAQDERWGCDDEASSVAHHVHLLRAISTGPSRRGALRGAPHHANVMRASTQPARLEPDAARRPPTMSDRLRVVAVF